MYVCIKEQEDYNYQKVFINRQDQIDKKAGP